MAKTATPAAPATLTEVTMTFDKETPGTVRYADATDGSVLPILYLRKDAFTGGTYPATITVKVTA